MTLQLHHKNGNPCDDRLENLQILCPNCHSQTHSFCKRKEIRSIESTQNESSEVNAG
ncbi:MAG: HNH endonuclease [Methanobrevibacter sp.]|nr:HNH endonuclease [Methanobrevibacter sp.]